MNYPIIMVIDLKPGQDFMIRHDGCAEKTIFIKAEKETLVVQGMANCNSKKYRYGVMGVEEVIN